MEEYGDFSALALGHEETLNKSCSSADDFVRYLILKFSVFLALDEDF